MNLLQETLDILKEFDKTGDDVLFCSLNGYFSFEKFRLISDFEYDDGYGTAKIPEGLRIVGKDWWLERSEYDGAEWWDFKTIPNKPKFENSNPILK